MKHPLLALAAALVLTGCEDPLALPPPSFQNTLDTATIYALRGTDLTLPSGFDIVNGAPSRTDRAEPFDIAFDLADDGRALLYPAFALGVNTDAAVLISSDTFDGLVTAPSEGYERDTAVAVTPGTVFVGRSRSTNQACALLGSLPRYGKFRVLSVNTTARSITIESLINANCGYRDLVVGYPEN